MGADYQDQKKAIEELRSLSEKSRCFLGHHFRNSLTIIKGNIYTIRSHTNDALIREKLSTIEVAADHMVEDLEKIGC
jgi:hypothetical protein